MMSSTSMSLDYENEGFDIRVSTGTGDLPQTIWLHMENRSDEDDSPISASLNQEQALELALTILRYSHGVVDGGARARMIELAVYTIPEPQEEDGPDVGRIPVAQRVWDSANREARSVFPGLRLRPEYLSVAYRALADFTLLLAAQEYRRDPETDTDSPWDMATRTGRFMHLLGDLFHERTREEPILATDYDLPGMWSYADLSDGEADTANERRAQL